MKSAGKIVGVIIIFLIALVVLGIKFYPVRDIEFLRNNTNPISKIICTYSVKVSGDSMEPFLQPNTTVSFDKCFDENDLKVGTVIIFKVGAVQRLGIIRSIQNFGRIVYKVSNETNSHELTDVLLDEIVGLKDLDTSLTSYKPNQEESISTELSDYMSRAYLGTIPRSAALESTKIKETTNFNLNSDKFCYVVNPIKDLVNDFDG